MEEVKFVKGGVILNGVFIPNRLIRVHIHSDVYHIKKTRKDGPPCDICLAAIRHKAHTLIREAIIGE